MKVTSPKAYMYMTVHVHVVELMCMNMHV